MTDTTRFAGHGVLVTGAARGIGAATARRFAEEGARVLVTDVDPDAARTTADALRERGLAAEAFGCDVADRASVEAAVAHAVATFGTGYSDAFTLPDTESSRAFTLLERVSPDSSGDVLTAVFAVQDGSLADPEARATVEQVVEELAGLDGVVSWDVRGTDGDPLRNQAPAH